MPSLGAQGSLQAWAAVAAVMAGVQAPMSVRICWLATVLALSGRVRQA
jgi:hypothetical protein